MFTMNNHHSAQTSIECEKRMNTLRKIRKLPTSVGVILLGAGVSGLILPGMAGLPLLIAGGLVLAPWTVTDTDRYLLRKFPAVYGTGMEITSRFLEDLERRYPQKSPRKKTDSVRDESTENKTFSAHRKTPDHPLCPGNGNEK